MGSPEKPRALIVEDELLVLLDLEDTLTDLGYVVVAKAPDIEQGLVLAREVELDVAVLDLNLAGTSSAPIADVLSERGVPFVLASGYTEMGIPERHRGCLRIAKPYETATLGRLLRSALGVKAAGVP